MGEAVGKASPSLIVQTLFSLPVLLTAILKFGSRPLSINVGQRRLTSGSVLSVKSKSGVVENMGVEVGIAAPSVIVEKLLPLPV